MNGFIALEADRQKLLLEQAAEELDLPEQSLEKDFWVCWTLRELFSIPDRKENLTFKGGTSLSKCWGIIDRFSEDIDIVIDKSILGFDGENSPEAAPSKKQKKKRLDAMKASAQKMIHGDLASQLRTRMEMSLPEGGWNLRAATGEEDPDGQTLMFEYPSVTAGSSSYIQRIVKIEMGARSDSDPVQDASVHPYLADTHSELLGDAVFIVRALAAERTFWEKAMLLQEETYRPDHKQRKARMARHYYDLYRLIEAGIADKARMDETLFARVAKHREVYFNWSWFDYGTLTRGSLRVFPLPEQEQEWRNDYAAMTSDMFFGEVPAFDDILSSIKRFQDDFNSTNW